MVDVLLVQPPIRDFYLTYKRTIPHGLACIAASLEKSGFTVNILDGLATAKSRVIDVPSEMTGLADFYRGPDSSPISLFHHFRHFGYSLQYIGQQAKAADAFLIGISSLFTAYWDMALMTAQRIREVCPQAKIVVGGHHPTASPESVIACDEVDYVLRGEGEVGMPVLAHALKEGTTVTAVPGIAFRKKDAGVHISPPAMMEDLDEYPLPAFHLLKNDYYKRKAGRTAVIMTSRGCPRRCTYCSFGDASEFSYRRRKEDCILSEIEAVVTQHNVRFIDFEDEHISLKRRAFIQLLEQLITRFKGYELEFRAMNGLYPPSLDEEILRLMKKAGFKALNLSLCSTSSEQLQQFQRPDVSRSLEDILAVAEELDMETVAYIIVGAPGQEPLTSVEDLLYLAQRRVLAGVSVYYPSPGSRDFERCKKENLLPEKQSLYRSSALPLSDRTSRRDSVTLLRLGRILNFMAFLDDHAGRLPDDSTGAGSSSGIEARTSRGIKLLQLFFKDGQIRGVNTDGTLFTHETSLELSEAFIEKFKTEGNRFRRWHSSTLDLLLS